MGELKYLNTEKFSFVESRLDNGRHLRRTCEYTGAAHVI